MMMSGEQERRSALAPYTILDLPSVETAAKVLHVDLPSIQKVLEFYIVHYSRHQRL